MKTRICEVCEKRKDITELKHGRYCNLVVCESCRQADPESDTDEEWTPIKK